MGTWSFFLPPPLNEWSKSSAKTRRRRIISGPAKRAKREATLDRRARELLFLGRKRAPGMETVEALLWTSAKAAISFHDHQHVEEFF
jgi:hypothetical protein